MSVRENIDDALELMKAAEPGARDENAIATLLMPLLEHRASVMAQKFAAGDRRPLLDEDAFTDQSALLQIMRYPITQDTSVSKFRTICTKVIDGHIVDEVRRVRGKHGQKPVDISLHKYDKGPGNEGEGTHVSDYIYEPADPSSHQGIKEVDARDLKERLDLSLRGLLAEAPSQYQATQAALLREEQGLTWAEASERVGMNAKAPESSCKAARSLARKYLGDKYLPEGGQATAGRVKESSRPTASVEVSKATHNGHGRAEKSR
jgi:DNA-directed RNA polymerase specialized sigma24 family protein